MRRLFAVGVFLALALAVGSATAAPSFLEGTWVPKQAYEIKPDGSFAYPYGQTPQGILIVDTRGRYVVEIFGENRAKFPANSATLDDYKQAMTTMSVHTGQVEVDSTGGLLIFHVSHNGYAERDGTTQKRPYQLHGDVLSYKIPASAEGKTNIPVTRWEREGLRNSSVPYSPQRHRRWAGDTHIGRLRGHRNPLGTPPNSGYFPRGQPYCAMRRQARVSTRAHLQTLGGTASASFPVTFGRPL